MFKHTELKLIQPSFASPVTDLVIELDKLRDKIVRGSTHPFVFYQLKNVFHLLESITSARIEGNNTTIAEYIETIIDENSVASTDNIKEIKNITNAINFVEENIKDSPINRTFISEVHRIIVDGLDLNKEGDRTPGEYRQSDIRINKSSHIPPSYMQVSGYMEELFQFINSEESPKYDLLKVAIAHHRFVWIHPFSNGNGRTVRVLTYAMLCKLGFNEHMGSRRIINPTAIFCNNRDHYYNFLSLADEGSEEGTLQWCEYVLKGLKEEIEKIDKLLNYDYLKSNILIPMLKYSLDREFITTNEYNILSRIVEKQIIKARDLKSIFPDKSASEISHQIAALKKKNMIASKSPNERKYVLRFGDSYLLRSLAIVLGEEGFFPKSEIAE